MFTRLFFLLALVSSTSGAAGSSILSLINTIQPKTYLNAPVPLPLKPDQVEISDVSFSADDLRLPVTRFYVICQDEFCGLYNAAGQAIIPWQKIYIEHYDSETDLFYVSTSFTGNHTGLYSARQQQFIYPPVYSSIELAESSAIVFLSTYQNSAQLSGMGDAYGNVIIAPQFSSIQMINQRPDAFVAGKRMNGRILYGLLDFSGNIIIPFRYDTVSNTDYRYNINFIAVAKNGRWGVIDKTGNLVRPLRYSRDDTEKWLTQRGARPRFGD
ncbi:WG repeat-containing protein [Salmonella enterica subsp. enterica serovar Ramatgan]|nr:WG repeat-containing protein [Salmonella enterica subsp. enterica serovar Ramatgan]